MILKLLDKTVLDNSSNWSIRKGERVYNKGLVKNIEVEKFGKHLSIDTMVESENSMNIYNTLIELSLNPIKLIYTQCECDDHYRNSKTNPSYMCKHLIASYRQYTDEFIENNNKEKDKDIELLVNPAESIIENIIDGGVSKKYIELEICIYKSNAEYGAVLEVEFKIGGEKKFILKNIGEFIHAYKNGNEVKYGKDFIYTNREYYFSKTDEKLIEFICEYLELYSSFADDSNSKGNIKVLKGKSLIILDISIKRFLDIIKDKEVNFKDRYSEFKIYIRNEKLPVVFYLREEDDKLILKSTNENSIPLTKDGQVYFNESDIYILPKEQYESYKLYYDLLSKFKEIRFDENQRMDVVNTLLPQMKLISDKIIFEGDLKEKIKVKSLNVEFYFDKNKSNYFCNIKLLYGMDGINYFNENFTDQYIIRDLEKEELVLKTLEEYNFYRNVDTFIFSASEERLFQLLKEGMPKLEALGEVYYSNKFKEQKFYPNRLMSLRVKSREDSYLDFSFKMDNVTDEELKSIQIAFKNNRKFFRLRDGSFVDLTDEKTKGYLEIIENIKNKSKDTLEEFKVHQNKVLYIESFIQEKGLQIDDTDNIISSITNSYNEIQNIKYDIPKELNAELRGYQVEGYRWFKSLSYFKLGGILADEMGLGKTLQTITFLLSENGKKSIIIAPTSLIYNWKDEFEKFAPTMKVGIAHGSKDERKNILEEYEQYDVILTTYGTLRNDFSYYKDKIFDYCIIDEGQNIKNPLAQSSEATKEIKAKVKFALTGTPIENNLIELWSIFDYILPGYLYDANRFKERFVVNDNLNSLKDLIKPFILRREKREVMKELPDKIEKKFFVELDKEEKEIYKSYVEEIREDMKQSNFSENKITIFSYLTKLRQLCLDPSLIIKDYKGESSKINISLEILKDQIKEGNKVLLFSQFTSLLKNLSEVLKKNDIEFYYLDGSTNAKERINLVNKFNDSKTVKVFLISLKAGGTGLNLTSASVVIHFDPWWNPAIEDQATDRAHRFGQKSVVQVVKLIAKGTIEEKIIKLQEDKKELINNIMNGELKNGNVLSSLSQEELIDLFTL